MIRKYFQDFKVLKECPREYWVIQLINFLDCTAYFAMLSIATVFLSENMGFNDKNAGYVITIFTSAITIFLSLTGFITDSLGIKKSLYIAMGVQLFTRLGVGACGIMESFPYRDGIVVASFFIMAPAMAMVQTVFQSANKRFTTKRSRSAGFNLWYLFMNVGAAFGGFLIDVVRLHLGIANTWIFIFGGVLALVSGTTALLLIRRETQVRGNDEALEEVQEKQVAVRKEKPWIIAKKVVSESAFWRFIVLMCCLLGVRAVFAYMYLIMPKYWIRTIGPDVAMGTLQTINPILIVVGLILFIPLTNKFNIFKMLVFGAFISAISLFVLVLPWKSYSHDISTAYYTMAIVQLVILSIGEIIWSPKLTEYTAAIAPEGQEGSYMGMSMMPWFLAKTVVSVASGHLLTRYVPEGIRPGLEAGTVPFWSSPEAMWLLLGIFAVSGPIIALGFKNWLTEGADMEPAEARIA